MKQTEIDLLTKLFDTKAQDTDRLINQAMDDIRRTIAVSAANTDGQINQLDKTIKDQDGRLQEVEHEQIKHRKVVDVMIKAGKYWYVAAIGIIILILILIPVAQVLGIEGFLSFLK